MKFAASSEHRDFFRKNQVIEFEDVISEKQLAALHSAIDAVCAARLSITTRLVEEKTPTELFRIGRDLWRASDAIKSTVVSKKLAEIASELLEIKPLRMGYDQLIVAPNAYAEPLFSQPQTLEEISSIQGILGGVMLCLKGRGLTEEETIPTFTNDLFSNKAGSGVFFRADTIIDFNQLTNHLGQRYLLVVYTHAVSVYIHSSDPNAHFLKQFGYNFGDKLNDKLHPIVFR
jgi:hypothetical protein